MKPFSTCKIYCVAAICAIVGTSLSRADDAQAPSYYRDVVPILQANCTDCHRQAGTNLGGIIAPMALTSYQEVRPWAKSVAKAVESRQMPPWHATREFHGIFRNERTLSDAQIELITRWVSAGCPEGDSKDAPATKQYATGEWSIGKPDLVLKFDKPFHVGDNVEDLNNFVTVKITPDILPEDKYIVALEFKPGSEIVHHILGFIKPPAATGEGLQMVGGIAPGSTPINTLNGYGIKLFTNSTFIFQMHYHKEKGPGTGKDDVSSIAFKFADKPVHRLYVEAIGDPGRLYIPAASEKTEIMSRRKWDREILMAGFLPHMHLRGYYAKYEAVFPDGKREKLLEVPQWSFNWQMSYEYAKPRRFPAGTIVECTMAFDNSKNNQYNPDPAANLVFGEKTTDEMNLGWITWGYAEPTDKDPVPRAIGGRNDDLPTLPGGPPEGLKQARKFSMAN